MNKENIDVNVVRDVLTNYDLDKETLVKFLYDLGELYNLEELVEIGGMLDD